MKRSVQAPPGDKAAMNAVPAGSAAALIDRANADTLVFVGADGEIQRLKAILPEVDTPTGEVLVRGMIYEVQTGRQEGSVLQLAAAILGGNDRFGALLVLHVEKGRRCLSSLYDDRIFK